MGQKEWIVPVNWQLTGNVRVNADTLEEAMLKVKHEDGSMPLPEETFYVDSSFELAYGMHEVEFVRQYENNGQEDVDQNRIN